MADIITYYPTAGLTIEERNTEGIYAALKTWVQDLSDIFTKWFDVTYTDDKYTIVLNPKDIDIASFRLEIKSDAGKPTIDAYYTPGYEHFSSLSGKESYTDSAFYLYDSPNGFFIGLDSKKIHYAVLMGTSFGTGIKKQVVATSLVNDSTNKIYFCTSGTRYKAAISNDFYRAAANVTDVYRIQPMPVSFTDIVLDSGYCFDGGMSTPPAGVFKVGTDTYCSFFKNICLKL